MSIDDKLKNILEATLMSIARPMTIEQMMKLFDDDERPSVTQIKEMLKILQQDCDGRGIELKEIASGYRYQARQEYSEWLSRLWEEKPSRYSRAYLETLALIAYRQPVTRAEIEEVRGVSVSTSIVRTMLEREWIRVVGHRDVPGRPSLYATTRQFLDYFNMKSLDELPSLAEIRDLEELSPELGLPEPGQETNNSGIDMDTLVTNDSGEVSLENSQKEVDDAEIVAAESEVGEYVDGEGLEQLDNGEIDDRPGESNENENSSMNSIDAMDSAEDVDATPAEDSELLNKVVRLDNEDDTTTH